ncbi:unnamed protein product [Boreogadus saida]
MTCTHNNTLCRLIQFSLLYLLYICKVCCSSKPFQLGDYSGKNNTLLCQKDFMSFFISKQQVENLPFAIYVQDEQGRSYEAMAIAHQCHYLFQETDNFVILTVSYHGCFVTRQKHYRTLNVLIIQFANNGGIHMGRPTLVRCITEQKEEITEHKALPKSPQLTKPCDKNGFNIVIHKNATVIPLNLDTIRIPSNRSVKCKPKTRSINSVTFSFPFTECGTRSVEMNNSIIYWINIGARRVLQRSTIRTVPFRQTVMCSFALPSMSLLDVTILDQKPEHQSALKSDGTITAELRFAKDSSYRSFITSRSPPKAIQLGQPVYVEVHLLKCEDGALELLLEDCWATPTHDPDHTLRWNLLVKRCPFGGDSHEGTLLLPVKSSKEVRYPSLRKRFITKLFSFVNVPPGWKRLVYFHCNIEICKGQDCTQCDNKRVLQTRQARSQRILPDIVSAGPLILLLNK